LKSVPNALEPFYKMTTLHTKMEIRADYETTL
jgi:hypothetical protein